MESNERNVFAEELTPAVLNDAVSELNDLVFIYLDLDIAGDNDDRRNKLKAASVLRQLVINESGVL